MGALRRNAVPAFPESRLRSGARLLCVLASLASAVQDRIAHGQDAVCIRTSPGSSATLKLNFRSLVVAEVESIHSSALQSGSSLESQDRLQVRLRECAQKPGEAIISFENVVP